MNNAKMAETIIEIFVALGGVVAALSPLYSDLVKSRKRENEREERDRVQDERARENYLAILRLTVMNSEMPMSERLIAGEKYIKAGGNGDVKKYYEELCNMHIC